MENFEHEIIHRLERTPLILEAMLRGVCEELLLHNEGENTWNTKQVLAHLVYMEQNNWCKKLGLLLNNTSCKTFDQYSVKQQFQELVQKNSKQWLDEFIAIRTQSLQWLRQAQLNKLPVDDVKGCLKQYGDITLRELLSTWVAHDLTHIHQISRIIAKNFKEVIVLDLIA